MRADLYIDSVLEKCVALRRGGIWAPEPQLRPGAWLDNFESEEDKVLAAILLDNFLFFSARAADRVLRTAYFRLEDDVLAGRVGAGLDRAAFLDRLVFTPVEGESPRPTDSGKMMCRKLRDLTELPDNQFFEPAAAIQQALAGHPVVFVDDFVGSGEQLIRTWNRDYSGASFASAYATAPFHAYCLAMFATDFALDRVARCSVPITLRPTHVLAKEHQARSLDAPPLIPPLADFRSALHAFLSAHTPGLKLPCFLSQGDDSLFGFSQLGLLFGTEYGVPDSTLPIVWARGAGSWIQLVRLS